MDTTPVSSSGAASPPVDRLGWSLPWAGAIVALCLLSYATVLLYAGWIWDDADYVLKNPVVRGADGLAKIWFDPSATPQYYPLVYTSFRLEYLLVGPADPKGPVTALWFHITNILLFALTALCFWRVLLRLMLPGALLAVLLFAAHPINVESVAWITERKNMLSGLFGMLTVLAFLRHARIGDDESAAGGQGWGCLAATLVFWVCGLCSKTTIAFIPPALFLILWWRRPSDLFRPRNLLPLLAMLALGVVAGLHTKGLEQTLVGVTDGHFPEIDGPLDRLMLAGTVVWVYLQHLLVPYEQIFFYPKWDPSPQSWWQWILLSATVALPLVLLWQSKRIGRGPLVAVLVFGGALFPVMGFANVYPMRLSWVADHFQYHANFAMLALVATILVRVRVPRRIGIALFSIVIAVFVVLSNHHGRGFENVETLYRRILEKNKGLFLVWENLGVEIERQARELQAAGRVVEANRRHQEALWFLTEGLKVQRDPHLLRSLATWHTFRFLRNQDAKDLDIAERYAQEGNGSLELANICFFRGPGHGARAIELFETVVREMIEDSRQASFARWKLTGSGRRTVENLAKCYLDLGLRKLSGGDPAAALELWSRPRRSWKGDGTQPLNELYPWSMNVTSRWVVLELHRLWVLAAHADSGVRNSAKALSELQQFFRIVDAKLQEGGVAPDQRRRVELLAMDIEAAASAGTGQFQRAVELTGQVLRAAGEMGYRPKVWLEQVRQRRQSYERRKAWVFRDQVSLPNRYRK